MSTSTENMHLWAGGETHRGNRASNQDALIIEPALGLYAVLDGMGGAAAGDVAARLASEKILEFVRRYSQEFSPRELLEFAIDAAAVEVFTTADRQAEYHGMGTTVVACLVVEPMHVVIGHVGDSRAYLLHHGRLEPLTRDHTIAQRYVDDGSMNSDEAERSWFKHILTRNLGAEHGVRPDMLEKTLQHGDRVLLCSDGLYGSASTEAIRHVLNSSNAPEHIARKLIDLALQGEALDNISAVVIAAEEHAAASSGGEVPLVTHTRAGIAERR